MRSCVFSLKRAISVPKALSLSFWQLSCHFVRIPASLAGCFLELSPISASLAGCFLGKVNAPVAPSVTRLSTFDFRLSTNQTFDLRLKVIRLSTFDFRLSTKSNQAFDLRLWAKRSFDFWLIRLSTFDFRLSTKKQCCLSQRSPKGHPKVAQRSCVCHP